MVHVVLCFVCFTYSLNRVTNNLVAGKRLYHDKRTFKEIDENLHQLDEAMVSDEE